MGRRMPHEDRRAGRRSAAACGRSSQATQAPAPGAVALGVRRPQDL